jgi:hypothetical protein
MSLRSIAIGSPWCDPFDGRLHSSLNTLHAEGTRRACKRRWHLAMLPAPPTSGLPPLCVSPAAFRRGKTDRLQPSQRSRDRAPRKCDQARPTRSISVSRARYLIQLPPFKAPQASTAPDSKRSPIRCRWRSPNQKWPDTPFGTTNSSSTGLQRWPWTSFGNNR